VAARSPLCPPCARVGSQRHTASEPSGRRRVTSSGERPHVPFRDGPAAGALTPCLEPCMGRDQWWGRGWSLLACWEKLRCERGLPMADSRRRPPSPRSQNRTWRAIRQLFFWGPLMRGVCHPVGRRCFLLMLEMEASSVCVPRAMFTGSVSAQIQRLPGVVPQDQCPSAPGISTRRRSPDRTIRAFPGARGWLRGVTLLDLLGLLDRQQRRLASLWLPAAAGSKSPRSLQQVLPNYPTLAA
jgi:hypothetical protein